MINLQQISLSSAKLNMCKNASNNNCHCIYSSGRNSPRLGQIQHPESAHHDLHDSEAEAPPLTSLGVPGEPYSYGTITNSTALESISTTTLSPIYLFHCLDAHLRCWHPSRPYSRLHPVTSNLSTSASWRQGLSALLRWHRRLQDVSSERGTDNGH